MNVSIIGAGYVGLVSGVCLSEKGHNVVCVDNDQDKVDLINSGQFPFASNDNHLISSFERAVKQGNLKATKEIS